MRKLKLNELTLGDVEVLTREHLKKVLGGSGSGSGNWSCEASCGYDSDCESGYVCRESTCDQDHSQTQLQCVKC